MFDQETLDQLHANYLATRPQTAKKPQPKKKGNFLTSLIPSGGGIAGAAGGAAIGTAILPGIGTLGGALIGGALGGGLGKVAENKVEGNALGSGVGQEAAINGILGAGPLRLGKLGIDAARGLKAGSGLADAVANAGTNAATMSATKAAGAKLSKAGEGLIAKEFRLNPTQQANFKNLHGEEAVSVLRRYGIKKPEDLQTKIAPLQNAFDATVKSIPAINGEELRAGLAKVYQPLLKSPAQFEQQLGQQLKSQADELLKTVPSKTFIASSGGEVAGNISKDQATKRVSQIDRLINKSQTQGGVGGDELRKLVREKGTLETALKNGNFRTEQSISAAKVNEFRKTFDNAVKYTQKGAPEYNVIKKTADALRGTLQGAAEKAGIKTAEGQSFKDVGLELRKLHNLNDIVGKQSYLGTGSLPASLPNLLGYGAGGATGGIPGAVIGGLGTSLINSPMGRRAVANTTLKAGEKLTAKAAKSNPYGVIDVAKRVAPAGLANAAVDQLSNSSINPEAASPSNIANTINPSQNMGTSSQVDANLSTDNSPFAPQNLENAIQQILANGGSLKDASDFVNLAGTLQKLQTPNQGQPIKKTEAQRARDEASALTDQALTQLQGGGVATGPIGSRLEDFKSKFNAGDPSTVQFNTTISSLKAAIAKARAGTSFTPNEEALLNRYAPQSGDSMQQLMTKLQNLQVVYQQAAQREYGTQYSEAPTDLTSALLAAQSS